MSQSSLEAIGMLEGVEASEPSSGAAESLQMSGREALAWAREISLENAPKLTEMQTGDLCKAFEHQSQQRSSDDLRGWRIDRIRRVTTSKLQRSPVPLCEQASESAERYSSDREWFKLCGRKPLDGLTLTPIGEQLVAAIYLREKGEEEFLAAWELAREARAVSLSERERERRYEEIAAERERILTEKFAEGSEAAAVLQAARDRTLPRHWGGQPQRRYGFRRPTLTMTLRMDELAALLGLELPELPSRERPGRGSG